jgi:hypothetical protein
VIIKCCRSEIRTNRRGGLTLAGFQRLPALAASFLWQFLEDITRGSFLACDLVATLGESSPGGERRRLFAKGRIVNLSGNLLRIIN